MYASPDRFDSGGPNALSGEERYSSIRAVVAYNRRGNLSCRIDIEADFSA